MTDDDAREMLERHRRARKAEELVRQFLADWSEDDTAIRDLCRPVLGDFSVDGDSHGVPPLVEVVRMTIEKLKGDKPPPRRHVDCPKCGSKNCRFMRGVGFEAIRLCTKCQTNWEDNEQWDTIHKLTHQ